MEDLWLEHEAQNIPGTDFDRPNWVGRARLSLEEIRSSDTIALVLKHLDAARRSEEENR